MIGADKNRGPGYVDYCHEAQAILAPTQAYYDIFQGLKDSTGEQRPIIWADIGPVSLSLPRTVGPVEDTTALPSGTLRNVDCPVSFGPGYRHLEMGLKFDSTLNDMDSICDPNYHQALLNIAARAVAGQTIQVSGIPDPTLIIVAITRSDGSVQNCTTSGTSLSGTNPTVDNITYEQTSTGKQLIHFNGACERELGDKAVDVQLLCAD
jgi:hypothetical protein